MDNRIRLSQIYLPELYDYLQKQFAVFSNASGSSGYIQSFNRTLNSGVSSQRITLPTPYSGSLPVVTTTLVHPSGSPIIAHGIDVKTGYFDIFLTAAIPSSGYSVNVLVGTRM
jgi:hypothetical protein